MLNLYNGVVDIAGGGFHHHVLPLPGAQEGDEVTVEAPMGALVYRVKKIER